MFCNGRDLRDTRFGGNVMFYNGRDLRDTRFGGM